LATYTVRKLALAVSLGAAFACGNNNNPTVGNTSTALEFCNTVSNILDDKFTSCQGATPDFIALQKKLATTNCQAVAKEVTSGRVGYDSGHGAVCATELHGLSCAAFFARQNCGDGLLKESDACEKAIPGKVATGGQCYDSSNCAAGFCNGGVTGGACPGTCVPYATVGQDCGNTMCDPSLECELEGATRVCKSKGRESGACPCEDGLYCDKSGPTPTCKAPKTSGSCSSLWDCAIGFACAGDDSAGSSFSCQAMGKAGDACTPIQFGDDRCAPGLHCNPGTSTCGLMPKAGEPCAFQQGTMPCLDGVCDELGTKQCKGFKDDGQACIDSSECRGLCDASSKCSGSVGLACAAP
jgi:hypothetical protein